MKFMSSSDLCNNKYVNLLKEIFFSLRGLRLKSASHFEKFIIFLTLVDRVSHVSPGLPVLGHFHLVLVERLRNDLNWLELVGGAHHLLHVEFRDARVVRHVPSPVQLVRSRLLGAELERG